LARERASEIHRTPASPAINGSWRPAGAPETEAATLIRVSGAEEHAREAARLDEQAHRRDIAAAKRDRAAEARDDEIARLVDSASPDSPALESILEEVRVHRALAAADRARAADDRRRAAVDRGRAAEGRAAALAALRGAHFDDLTGALRRGFGEDLLRAEIERARRANGPLVLVIVDVDGLKEVNDTQGHLAGDQVLRDLVAAIRANIRSYEPIVRLGGDEFAFAIGGVDRRGAKERCAVIRADLARRPSRGRISVGIGELRPGDELQDVFHRADAALVDARRAPDRGTRPRPRRSAPAHRRT
jgi:diguanylate cyclase (GGDEF)-like protein